MFYMMVHDHKNENLIRNFLVGHGQKYVWPVWSWDSKIECISKMNRWNKSLHAGTKSQNLTVDSMIFGCGQKWLWPFLMRH